MRVAEASAVVPLSPEEARDLLIGDQMHRLVEMPGAYEPAAEGTRVSWRWEIEPQSPLTTVMRPLLAQSMRHDLDALARVGDTT